MNQLVNFIRRFFLLIQVDRIFAWLSCRFVCCRFLVRIMPPPYMYPTPCYRTLERNGIRIRLDLSQYIDWTSYYCLDPEHKQYIYPQVNVGMTVLDIGSNMGEMALNFAKRTGPTGLVVGFEPVPENYERCKYNFSLNDLGPLSIENLALGRETGQLYFDSMPAHNSGGAVLAKEPSIGSVLVRMMSVDEFVRLRKLPKVDFIKIDVEGFEMEVLLGGVEVINKYRPVLCVEVNDEHLKRFGSSEADLMCFFNEHRYMVKIITPKVLTKSGCFHYDVLAEPKSGTDR